MKYISTAITLIILAFCTYAQKPDMPDDFLDSEFHKERRSLVREKMPANSVAVFFANPVRNRANDVDYLYHQDPNFYYLTGYKEPNAVLLIFKDEQEGKNGSYNEIIFVQPRNEMYEMWTGRRMGPEGVTERLDIQNAFNNTEFKDYGVDFTQFDKVLFYDFKNDVRDGRDEGDLYSLIEQFKDKVGYPDEANVSLNVEPQKNNLDMKSLDQIMVELRGVKTEDELNLLKRAVKISAMGQREVMKAMRPGMSEAEVQGIHEFVFKKYRAEYEGYPSIVGAGHNGCILHYIDNYKPEVESDELVLMDLGAEYHGYTADVTRTIPVSGKFSKEQKQIYDLVYKAQEKGWESCKSGISMREISQITRDVINEGLFELGIIDSVNQRNLYYPHGCCHHIGLDVHDKGKGTLEENMVITIEPGIYIPEGSACDEKWWKIAVRIEDDFLIQKEGCELLSDLAPRESSAVEALMLESSPLDNFILPALEDE